MPSSSDPIQSRTPPGSLPPITNQAHTLPPHHYEHPSIPPLVNIPDARRTRNPTTLPEIQSWVNSPQISSTQSSSSRYQDQTPYRSQPSPPIIRLQHGSEDSHNAPSSHAWWAWHSFIGAHSAEIRRLFSFSIDDPHELIQYFTFSDTSYLCSLIIQAKCFLMLSCYRLVFLSWEIWKVALCFCMTARAT